MGVYAIGDLHLSFDTDKPMDIFGWKDYEEIIKKHWLSKINEEDTVIIPGDFSWATYLPQSIKDFRFINELTGKKIILKGNHDYWWETLTKMNRFLSELGFVNISFLYNNSYEIEGKVFCGTKGWDESEADEKIINREIQRFELSLSSVKSSNEIIGVFHYPPYNCPGLMDLMKGHNIRKCIYGHIHGTNHAEMLFEGIECILVSSDFLGFSPLKIL